MSEVGDEFETVHTFKQSDGTRRVILRFPMDSYTMFQRFAVKFVNKPVHVDMVLDKQKTTNRKFYYTMYMGEKFTMNMIPKYSLDDKLFENWAFSVTDGEFEKMTTYISKLVDRVTYNYVDTMMLMPMMPHTGMFVDTMVPDVDGTQPENLHKLFCSQAMVLILRESLDEDGPNQNLLLKLRSLNSRLTSPSDLYHLLRNYSSALPNKELGSEEV